jgi:hypothetical protein
MENVEAIVERALADFERAPDPAALENAKARYLGKSGELTARLKSLGRLPAEARKSALAKCTGQACRVVASVKRGCAALAVDFTNGCGAHGWGKASELGHAQNAALRACYRAGGKECVIRTFFCDGRG